MITRRIVVLPFRRYQEVAVLGCQEAPALEHVLRPFAGLVQDEEDGVVPAGMIFGGQLDQVIGALAKAPGQAGLQLVGAVGKQALGRQRSQRHRIVHEGEAGQGERRAIASRQVEGLGRWNSLEQAVHLIKSHAAVLDEGGQVAAARLIVHGPLVGQDELAGPPQTQGGIDLVLG